MADCESPKPSMDEYTPNDRKRKHEDAPNEGGDPMDYEIDDDYRDEDFLIDEEKEIYDDDDDKDAEGDERHESTEIEEPSEENFGKIKFYQLCKSLEKISSRPVRLKQKLMNLLPPKGIEALKKTEPGGPPQTPFPVIRLLCPEKDSSREYFVKHNTLAKAYIKAHAWQNNSPIAQALLKPTDPNKIAAAKLPPVQGDLTELIRKVLTGRIPDEPSSLTVTDVNTALDELAAFKHRGNMRPSNHDWEAGNAAAVKRKKNEMFEKLGVLQADWIKRLLSGSRRLSPLEHKWLARMILKEMKISMGFDKILYWFDPLAPALWSGHNSLRALCKIICQPDFHDKAVAADDGSGDSALSMAPYLTKSAAQIQFGVPFTPMFSHRTGFDRMLYDLSLKHRTYLKDPIFGKLEDKTNLSMASCMVLEHPAFTVETKLDGERMLVHLSRDGFVRIHSRWSNWYSEVYSPVLGPAIREAFGHLNMDMIIDGEILAWDDDKKETIPFGNNQTVARLRIEYMKYLGSLDTRDRNLHRDESEFKVMHANRMWQNEDGQVPDLNGKDCWLQFIAFDVVYVDGEGAKDLLQKVVSPHLAVSPGSLMDLECMERKKVLYHVIKRVDRFVEVVPTLVVSCDGTTYKGDHYFSLDLPPTFGGRPLYSLESAASFLHEVSDHSKAGKRRVLEEERRQGFTNEEVSTKRAHGVGEHYKRIVEDQRQEGLIFKDLSSPYVLDKVSRSLGYWRKFKPDYFNMSAASDLDLVIVGTYFASGLRNSGRPNSYLCACISDHEKEGKYVPCCKVNGGSISKQETNVLLEHTGYKPPTNDAPLDTGKWFSYGESTREFPDFVSSYSFATSETGSLDGWKPKKEDYPDLWINPEDSVVLKLNAGEIVPSTAFPSRVTLRFPRIIDVRRDKMAREVESLRHLWDIHSEVMDKRAGDNSERVFESGNMSFDDPENLRGRFWTEERYTSTGRGRRKKRPKTLHTVSTVRGSFSAESMAFHGAVFIPLEGLYRLAENSLEADEAREEGWRQDACAIKDLSSVRALIKRHGGTAMLAPDGPLLEQGALVIGGDKNDPRVVNLVGTVEKARRKAPELKMKKKPTKADQDTLSFAECNGVVRWTFLLSVLAKWRTSQGSKMDKTSILGTDPNLLTPDSLDYLARPKCPQGDILGELCRIDVPNPIKMRRLLNEVAEGTNGEGEAEATECDSFSWQDMSKKCLEPSERWIMRCSNQTLWPYVEDRVVIQETAIYVDVFADPRSFSNELSMVDPFEYASYLSVLPLLRLAGAFIETRLGARVTHVLSDLRDKVRTIPFEKAKPELFVDPQRGELIIEAVKKSPLYPESCPEFVSPSWAEEVLKRPDSA